MFNVLYRPSILKQSLKAFPVILGTSYLLRPRTIIFNDAVAISQTQKTYAPESVATKARHSRLSGKLDYGELCLGSVTGLFLGIIIGKLSSAIVFLTASSYLLLQFLENKGVIKIPWTSILTIGGRKWDLKSLFFNQPSFKLSFVSSFLIAAFNV